jgi:uncharacterized membrane protein YeaQ/YmgE (transglycosylase-associated protein family)
VLTVRAFSSIVNVQTEKKCMEFIWFILIGLVAGALAGQIVRGGGFGVLGDIIVGIVGALLGGFLFNTFGVSTGSGLIGSLIVATIGAVVLLYGIRLVNRTS